MIAPQPKLPTETELGILRKHWLLVALIFSTFVANWFAPMVLVRIGHYQLNPFDAIVVGLVTAQLFAVAHFLTLFPAHLAFRACLTCVFALLGLLSFAVGTQVFGSVSPNAFATTLGVTPGAILAASIPFWVGKHLARWRLFFRNQTNDDDGRLTIAALLIGTTFSAFCLSLATVQGMPTEAFFIVSAELGCVSLMFFVLPTPWFHYPNYYWLVYPVLLSSVATSLVVLIAGDLFFAKLVFSITAMPLVFYGLYILSLKLSGLNLMIGTTNISQPKTPEGSPS